MRNTNHISSRSELASDPSSMRNTNHVSSRSELTNDPSSMRNTNHISRQDKMLGHKDVGDKGGGIRLDRKGAGGDLGEFP
jgi:hypothetical protein